MTDESESKHDLSDANKNAEGQKIFCRLEENKVINVNFNSNWQQEAWLLQEHVIEGSAFASIFELVHITKSRTSPMKTLGNSSSSLSSWGSLPSSACSRVIVVLFISTYRGAAYLQHLIVESLFENFSSRFRQKEFPQGKSSE